MIETCQKHAVRKAIRKASTLGLLAQAQRPRRCATTSKHRRSGWPSARNRGDKALRMALRMASPMALRKVLRNACRHGFYTCFRHVLEMFSTFLDPVLNMIDICLKHAFRKAFRIALRKPFRKALSPRVPALRQPLWRCATTSKHRC